MVTVNANPVVNIGNDLQICAGTSATLNAAITGVSYVWNTGANTQSISVNTSGHYDVVVSDANGCKGKDEILVTVAPPIVLDLGNDTTICEGKTLELNAKNPDKNFTWSTGEKTSSIIVSSAGNYWVEVVDAFGCKSNDNITICIEKINDPFAYHDTTICEGEKILLKANANPYLVRWTNGGDNSEISVGQSGIYNAAVSSKYCKEDYYINVTVIDTPEISIINKYGKEYYCFENEKAVLLLEGKNLEKYSIQWQHSLGENKEIQVIANGLYSAIISNAQCSVERSINIKEYCAPTFFIPNSFSPNGDGYNDYFPNLHSGLINDYEILIFNRWGELLFKSNNINDNWDGKVNGRIAQIDTYVYKISYSIYNESNTEQKKEKLGIVTLVK